MDVAVVVPTSVSLRAAWEMWLSGQFVQLLEKQMFLEEVGQVPSLGHIGHAQADVISQASGRSGPILCRVKNGQNGAERMRQPAVQAEEVVGQRLLVVCRPVHSGKGRFLEYKKNWGGGGQDPAHGRQSCGN